MAAILPVNEERESRSAEIGAPLCPPDEAMVSSISAVRSSALALVRVRVVSRSPPASWPSSPRSSPCTPTWRR